MVMKLCKDLVLSLMALALALLCICALPQTAQAAGESDLTFKLNETGDGYIVSGCSTSASGELEIPATYSDLPIVAIGNWVFRDCTNLTNIIIPNSITTIGNWAFFNCKGLVSATIPDSVISIGSEAFAWCDSLVSIIIPDSVDSIGDYAFFGCPNLMSIQVGKGNSVYHSEGNCIIETASKTLIAGCNTSLIPADGSVTAIDQHAFYYRTSLTSIVIPDSVTTIGNLTFYGCDSLTSVTIGRGVTAVGWEAFACCPSLTTVTIGNSVISLDRGVFFNCTSLTSITIPGSVTIISDGVFQNCTSLDSVTYCGTQAQWETTSIGNKNEPLFNAQLQFHNMVDDVCTICGHGKSVAGDADGDGKVNYKDAVYLLLNIMFGEESYPLNGAKGDIDGNGKVNSDDAIYLLLHVMFGEANYPLKKG